MSTDKVDTLEILPATLTLKSGYAVGVGIGKNIVLSPIEGWNSGASVRTSSTARSNAHGNFTERSWRGGKSIAIAGFAWGDNTLEAGQLVDEINAALADGSPGILVVDHAIMGRRWAEVVISQAPENDWDGESEDFGFTLYVTQSLPWKFGNADISDEVTSGGTMTVTNEGTADTPNVRYIVKGPTEASVTFTEVTSGSVIGFKQPIPVNSTLVIDASTGVALVDGVNKSIQLTMRNWVDVEAGETASFTFSAPGSGTALARVEVDPAWW